MWPFRRKAATGDRAARQSPAGLVPGPSEGWRSLRPIQRTVTPIEPVVGTTSFESVLPSWRDPTFLAPLGHQVSPDAPAGVVPAFPTPDTPSIQRAGELPLRQTPRRRPAAIPQTRAADTAVPAELTTGDPLVPDRDGEDIAPVQRTPLAGPAEPAHTSQPARPQLVEGETVPAGRPLEPVSIPPTVAPQPSQPPSPTVQRAAPAQPEHPSPRRSLWPLTVLRRASGNTPQHPLQADSDSSTGVVQSDAETVPSTVVQTQTTPPVAQPTTTPTSHLSPPLTVAPTVDLEPLRLPVVPHVQRVALDLSAQPPAAAHVGTESAAGTEVEPELDIQQVATQSAERPGEPTAPLGPNQEPLIHSLVTPARDSGTTAPPVLTPLPAVQAIRDVARSEPDAAPTLAAPRRPGLGAPLRQRPTEPAAGPALATAVPVHPIGTGSALQRSTPGEAMAAPRTPASVVEQAPTAEDAAPSATEPAILPSEPSGAPPEPGREPIPVQLVHLTVPDPLVPEPQRVPTAPLLPANPLRPRTAMQPVQRQGETEPRPLSRHQPIRESGKSFTVQEHPAGHPASFEPPRSGATAMGVQRAQQRAARTHTPVALDPMAAALSTGLATVDADGAVVFPGLASPAPEPAAQPAMVPTIQRDAVAPEPVAAGEAPAPASAGPTPPPSATSPAELDELAKRLYERIRTRLKAELRLDRERAGLVAGPYR